MRNVETKSPERLKNEATIESAYLPKPQVTAFEQSLLKRCCDSDPNSRKYKKMMGIWRITQRLIREVELDPADYEEQPEYIYNYCSKKHYSPETKRTKELIESFARP